MLGRAAREFFHRCHCLCRGDSARQAIAHAWRERLVIPSPSCDHPAYLASELHHSDIKAINSKAAPNAVAPKERTDVSINKGVVSAKLKPLSWNVIVTTPA